MEKHEHAQKSSLLSQAEQIVASQPEGVRGGVLLDGTDVGAEVSANVTKGDWTLGAVARWVKGKGKSAAAFVGWTPKG